MAAISAHVDTFAADNLPPPETQPVFLFDRPEFQYPERMNCAVELLDRQVAAGFRDKVLFLTPNETWTYGDLLDRTDRIAHALVHDLGLKPGNRVLLRAANNPMFMACWFAVAKAGGIVVATMPLLRGKEIAVMLEKAEIHLALCDERLAAEMEIAKDHAPELKRICYFNGSGETGAGAELESLMAQYGAPFPACDTARDDVVLIAFTSGTTGKPKGTMHFHRDVMAICDAFPRSCLKPQEDDIFIGSPPIAFTFGLGGLVLFPMRVGASAVLLEAAAPPKLAEAIQRFKATISFTAPTAYRVIAGLADQFDLSSLRTCVSAGETLPLPTFELWQEKTGIRIIDGIGATEMLHIFISAPLEEIRPGATGKPIPGYQAKVIDDEGNELPPGQVGRLAVRGPTGCRYLADPRQAVYVQNGWNVTGDAYKMDEDGYFWFQARADDMIISAGYNISGPEVEEALLAHPAVSECAVVASPDPGRGFVVKAFVVLHSSHEPDEAMVTALQNFVKAEIAPFKYPRAIEFVTALPKTETGKIQRFVLRQQEMAKAG